MSEIVRLLDGPFADAEVPVSSKGTHLQLTGKGVPEGQVARYTPTRDRSVYRFRGFSGPRHDPFAGRRVVIRVAHSVVTLFIGVLLGAGIAACIFLGGPFVPLIVICVLVLFAVALVADVIAKETES